MADEVDWEAVRRFARSEVRPADWPSDVRGISMEGVGLLGIDSENRLYWDGKEIVIRRKIRLATFERAATAIIALATFAAAAAAWYPIVRPAT